LGSCDDRIIRATTGRWGLDVKAVRHDLALCGSPERCAYRTAVECTDGNLYVLEEIDGNDIPRKCCIHARLDFLFRQGLARINPYLRLETGAFLETIDGRYFQISRFIPGVALKRPEYVLERWRGKDLSDFLINLREKSAGMPEFSCGPPFSIMAFIRNLVRTLADHEPDLLNQVQPAINFLETDFAEVHDRLPSAFCHGDFHALNIIWGSAGINAVIDWEFSGIKPDTYDAAMMIGCIGSENPAALAGPLVMDFISRLKACSAISRLSLSVLVEFVIALRFAWLSEWLRHDDRDMIDLETTYINLLCRHCDDLKRIWNVLTVKEAAL